MENWNNMKNTSKGIKNIIISNNFLSDISRTLSVAGVTTSNSFDIANNFNNYFTSIGKKQRKSSLLLLALF